MSWLPLRDRVRSLVLQWGFRVELLLLIKRSQLQHLTWMPPGCLLAEVFWACPTRRKPQGRVGTLGLHFSTGLVFPLKKMNEMAGEKEVLVSVQTAPPVTRTLSGRRWMDGSMDGWFLFYFYFILHTQPILTWVMCVTHAHSLSAQGKDAALSASASSLRQTPPHPSLAFFHKTA